ncbi:MAG TPA: hypothetical protein VF175_11505, partial [Lacipirellula sp.]
GCTLFYMLTGQAPFSQGTALQKLLQHQSERPPDLRSFRADVPDSVSRLVRRMLAKAPGDRQQTPVDLVGEISEIVEELGAPLPYAAAALPWTPPVRSNPRWRKHAVWAVPLAGLMLLGFVVDQVSRDDAGAAPFPALRTAPPTPSTATDALGTASAASATPVAADQVNLDESQPTTSSEATGTPASALPQNTPPLLLPDSWAQGMSLWDSVVNWPATSPLPRARELNEPEESPHRQVDVGMWSAPMLPPSPMIDLDLGEISASDDSPAENDEPPDERQQR